MIVGVKKGTRENARHERQHTGNVAADSNDASTAQPPELH
jgi:hypothetical protein